MALNPQAFSFKPSGSSDAMGEADATHGTATSPAASAGGASSPVEAGTSSSSAKAPSKMNIKAAAFVPSVGAPAFTPVNSSSLPSTPDLAGATTATGAPAFVPGMPGFPMPTMPTTFPQLPGMPGFNGVVPNPQVPTPQQAAQALTQLTESAKKESIEPQINSSKFAAFEEELVAQGITEPCDIDEHLQTAFCFLHQENMLTVSAYQIIEALLPGVSQHSETIRKDVPNATTLAPFWADFTVSDFQAIAETVLSVEECRAEEEYDRSKRASERTQAKKRADRESGSVKVGGGGDADSKKNNADETDGIKSDHSGGEVDKDEEPVDPRDWVDVVLYKEPALPVRFAEAYCQHLLPMILERGTDEEKATLDSLVEEMYQHRHQQLMLASHQLGDSVAHPPPAGTQAKADQRYHTPYMFLNEATRQELSEAVGYMLMVFYTAVRTTTLLERGTTDNNKDKGAVAARIEALRERLYCTPGSKSFVRWVLPLLVASDLADASITKAKKKATTGGATTGGGGSLNVATRVCDIKAQFAGLIPKLAFTFLTLPPRCSATRFAEALGSQLKDAKGVVEVTLSDLLYGYPRWKEQLFTESTNTVMYLATRPSPMRVPAVAPPRIQAIFSMDNKPKGQRSSKSLRTGGAERSGAVAGTDGTATPGDGALLDAVASASLHSGAAVAFPSIKVGSGQNTHKSRPLAETPFMDDVKQQIRNGLLTREAALSFALNGIVESDELATHTLTKAISAVEAVVTQGVWSSLEDVCNLPPPEGVINFFDVLHTYLMPKDHLHKRLVRQAARAAADRIKTANTKKKAGGAAAGGVSNSTLAGNVAGGGSETSAPGAGAPLLSLGGLDMGVWGAGGGGGSVGW